MKKITLIITVIIMVISSNLFADQIPGYLKIRVSGSKFESDILKWMKKNTTIIEVGHDPV